MKLGFYYGKIRWNKLTVRQRNKCWSMLMNLNGEAKKYYVKGEAYDNRDSTIAERLGLKMTHVRQYLCTRSIQHIKKINNKYKTRNK